MVVPFNRLDAAHDHAKYLKVPRVEVTVDYYLDNCIDKPLWRWVDGQEEYGMDPWRFYEDLPLDPEEIKERGWRIFVQERDLPAKPADPMMEAVERLVRLAGFEYVESFEGSLIEVYQDGELVYAYSFDAINNAVFIDYADKSEYTHSRKYGTTLEAYVRQSKIRIAADYLSRAK